MSIQDRTAAAVYQYCLNDMNPDMKPARIAALADRATAELVERCNIPHVSGYKITMPNDDRCMNIEVNIFRTLCEANGVDVEALYRSMN